MSAGGDGGCDTPAPKLAILHIEEDMDHNRYRGALIHLGLVLAQREIALHWKDPAAPHMGAWKKAMDLCMTREVAVYCARGCPHKHAKIWHVWAEYRGIATG